jgi:two-component system nitrogen regulation sensor histidine kinase GlnL
MARDLHDVLDAILAGVVVIDAEGTVEQLNTAACRILEHSVQAATGVPVERLLGPAHALARLGRKVLETGIPSTESGQKIESRFNPDLRVDVAASPLLCEGGALDGAVLVLRDRSAQRRLERFEAERERLAFFGRIAAGLAHEVRNPLGGIRGAGELLSHRAEDDKTRETADLIVRESTRIANLVDDFMVFARGDRLRLRASNLHRILDQVLDLLAHDPLSRECSIERAYDPSIPELLLDANRLTQVFLNLTRNAFQAMEGRGGRLTITTRMTLDHRVFTESGRLVPTVATWIRDTGPGMGEEELRQATIPFFTKRSDGTGLGLSVAEYWVSEHGGTLHIESAPGEGTTVRVTLPLRREEK